MKRTLALAILGALAIVAAYLCVGGPLRDAAQAQIILQPPNGPGASVVDPSGSQWTGDVFQRIAQIEASSVCPNGNCEINMAAYQGQNISVSGPLALNRSTVLDLAGNITYSGPALSTPLIYWADTSNHTEGQMPSGGKIRCLVRKTAGYDSVQAVPNLTGNSCAIVFNPSTSGTDSVIGSTTRFVTNVSVEGVTVIAASNKVKHCMHFTGFGDAVDVVDSACLGVNGITTPASAEPTDRAILYDGCAGGYDHDRSRILNNLIVGWAAGIGVNGQGCSEGLMEIHGNRIVDAFGIAGDNSQNPLDYTGQLIWTVNLYDADISSNAFAYNHLQNYQASVMLTGGLNPVFVNNHFDGDNMSDSFNTGNADCTASGRPYSCCTGNNTGTCSGTPPVAGNLACTGNGQPYSCCTGSQTGTCVAPQDLVENGVITGGLISSNSFNGGSGASTPLSNYPDSAMSIAAAGQTVIGNSISHYQTCAVKLNNANVNYYNNKWLNGTDANGAPIYQCTASGTTYDCTTGASAGSSAIADGTSVTYTGTIPNTPIIAGSVTVSLPGVQVGTDNGSGSITGSTISSGTINYTTGAWSVTFNSAPAAGLQISTVGSYYVADNLSTGNTIYVKGVNTDAYNSYSNSSYTVASTISTHEFTYTGRQSNPSAGTGGEVATVPEYCAGSQVPGNNARTLGLTGGLYLDTEDGSTTATVNGAGTQLLVLNQKSSGGNQIQFKNSGASTSCVYQLDTSGNLNELCNGHTNMVLQAGGNTLVAGLAGLGTAAVSGGGSLATGSNSVFGTITNVAATGNVLTPGFTCNNKVVLILSDETNPGTAKVTSSSTTTATFSATAGDTVDYQVGCR